MGNEWLDKAKGAATKAGDVAKKSGDVAKKGVDDVKDKSQQVLLKRKLDGIAAELGHVVYRQRSGEGGLDAEIDRLVGEMRGLRAEME
jgi:hypothetical protein